MQNDEDGLEIKSRFISIRKKNWPQNSEYKRIDCNASEIWREEDVKLREPDHCGRDKDARKCKLCAICQTIGVDLARALRALFFRLIPIKNKSTKKLEAQLPGGSASAVIKSAGFCADGAPENGLEQTKKSTRTFLYEVIMQNSKEIVEKRLWIVNA